MKNPGKDPGSCVALEFEAYKRSKQGKAKAG